MPVKSTSFPHEIRTASFSSERNKLKEIRFCRRKTPEDDNLKINVSPNIPFAFLLFKASAFYFREK